MFYQLERATVERLWAECSGPMYSLSPRQRQLGLGTEVCSPLEEISV